ncbi:MAG TPA: hypothetical protein VG755_37530 [Nannocystaceae bacterium]|nr:hypothetical protein [Nannocystaceae bacterium]
MIDYVIGRVMAWMDSEPVVGLMMMVAAVVTFAGIYRREGGPAPGPWAWLRRIVEAGTLATLLMGLLWAFRAVLGDNAFSFHAEHGRVSEANFHSLQTIWGAPHVQRELVVRHYRKVVAREEQFRDDPTLPPVFRDVEREELVDQDSIARAHGEVVIVPNQRKKGSGIYSGFEATFAVEYEVANPSQHATRTELELPLSGQVLYDELRVTVDGAELGPELRVDGDALRWERTMAPGERITIAIGYATRGVEHFYYQIPEPREIRDFVLAMRVVGLPRADVNYPEGCLTPSTIDEDGDDLLLRWQLDRSLTTAGMGVALPRPEQPGAEVGAVLSRSPYALMLLVGAVCLTLLVDSMGRTDRDAVALLDVALTCASYSLMFVVMAAAADAIGLWGAFAIGAAPCLALSWWLWRRHPSRTPVLALLGFFVAVHPLSALLPEQQEAFDAAVVAGLVLYLVALTLRARARARTQPSIAEPRTPTLEDLPVV